MKVAAITGAGSGIGRATAVGLASQGYAVALIGRRIDALQATSDACKAAPATLVIGCDVSNPTAVRSAFDAIEQKWGRLDVLFNNAGMFPPIRPLDEVTDEQWLQIVNVNLNGMFYCVRAAFALMKRQTPSGGRIINNGSIAAHSPRPLSIGYTATKHAVTGLTKATALEGRALGIACGQIDIGNASTEMTELIKKGSLQADGSVAPEATMNVKSVVDAVLYMVSLPLEANVQNMTVLATKMPFVGRG
jgi:NADP-dependent 3-hydroxy acid dehydrogenase YdfG